MISETLKALTQKYPQLLKDLRSEPKNYSYKKELADWLGRGFLGADDLIKEISDLTEEDYQTLINQ